MTGKSVVSLSFGAPVDPCLSATNCPIRFQNIAVAAIVNDKNIPVVAAAGNENSDACGFTPSSEKSAFTVAASDRNDNRATYSNWGRCVDILAPGTKIRSTWNKSKHSTRILSGTSMATPHVAGAFAVLLSDNSYSNVQDLYADLLNRATPGVIKDSLGFENKLLYLGA